MKKKHLGKKTLSVFLAALMLMTCWVFVAPEKAEAYADVNVPAVNATAYAGSVGSYNTPVFDKNHDRWFKFQNGDDWTTIYYPSNIYLDISETLQKAGYTFHVEWHFGDGTDYRILLGANVWGDHSQWPGYPDRYYAMTNAFEEYAVDASNPKDYPTGLYGTAASATDYDTRIIGYEYSSQGSDQFSVNDTTHTKYVLWRSNQATNTATLYLKGKPKATGTYDYNTSGSSFGSYGLAQKYGSGKWSTHDSGTTQFKSKGNSSSYMEGEWIEMQWTVTIYDKSALDTAVNTATDMINNAAYTRVYKEKLASALSTARTVLTKRATTQTEIDNAKNTLQSLIDAPEYRTYEITYENLFSVSDWWNSQSAIDGTTRKVTVDTTAGKVTVENDETVSSSEVVTNHSGSASTAGTRNTSCYSMPVTAGKSYTFKYTTDHKDTQMFAFFYDTNGGCTHSSTFGNYNFSAPQNGTGTATFTAPANSTQVEIRFDNNMYISTANYWDIMVYETDRANEIELDTWTTRPIRKVYTYNATSAASAGLDQPVRPGYKFDGWTNADGSAFTATTMTSSKVLYSTWSKKTLDVNYDNLFSFSDWYYSKSNDVNDSARGTMTADVEKGTMTFTATVNDFFCPNNGTAGYYTATVEPNTTYVLSYDLALTGGGMQVGVWYYNDSLSAVSDTNGKSYCISYSEADGYYEFTTPADCTKVAIRFGVTGADGAGTYSNIGIYEKAAYDDYATNYTKVREPFQVGDTDNLMYPTRDGYVFDGWEKADGTAITTVEGLTASETVYATWVKEYTVTFLDGDGSVLGTSTVKEGTAATAPVKTATKASDDNYSYTFSSWDKDFSNVTEDITVTPKFTSKAHTVAYEFVSDRTCTKNTMVDKYCATCQYYFFQNQEYDGTEIAEYIKLGHNFEGQQAISGSSNGEDGTHIVRCSRYTSAKCGGETRVAHNYAKGSTDNATCTTPGTVNWRCPCGQTKTTTGDLAPDVHNYDYTKGTPVGDNATHTVACTYNTAHTTSVACTDDDNNCYCDVCGQELIHSYVNETKDNVVSVAECEKDAVYYLTCQCGKYSTATWTDTGSALEHNWENKEDFLKSAADCENDAVYYKKCSLCGISSKGKTDATWTKTGTAWNHKFEGDYVSNDNGTHVQKCTNTGCTATGNENTCTYGAYTTDNAVTHSHTCTACDYTPAAENHNWGDGWKSDNSAGTTAGTQTRKCTVCGRTETKDCTYTSTHKAETCTTPEITTYTCSDCGHGYTVIGNAATGHDFSGAVKSYNDGTHAFLCANNCGNYGFDGIANAKTSCSYKYTNTASGTHKAECTECKYSFSEDCSGGQATCTAEAVCEKCTTAYGTTTDHSFKGAVKVLDGDVHAYLCEFCGTTTGIYGIGNTVNDTEACSGGDATCSALAVCDICKETHGELDEDDHKWGAAVTDAATAGEHTYTCDYNPDHKKNEACVSGSSVVVAPKCEEQGYTIQTCKECSYKWNTDYTAALKHNWVDPVCNNDGTHTVSCDNENVDGWVCDETLTLNCADSAITFGLTLPTCLTKGYTTYQCTACNYTWDADFVDATGHSYTKQLRKLDAAYKRSEKTCTEAETYWYCCDNCTVSAGTEADKYADNLASIYWTNGSPAGHKMESLVDADDLAKNRKSEATCTYPAVYYKSCSVCGAQDTETFTYKAALGHDYQDLVDADDLAKNRVSEATCTAAAVYYKSCSRCGDVSTDTFEYGTKIGHNMTKTDKVDATCSTAGNVEYYTCSNCNKNFSDEEGTTEISKTVIAALGHVWNSVAYKAANCEEDGHAAYKECTRCHEGALTEDQIYKATGHNFTGAYYCDTANNYHSKKCVNKDCTATGIVVDGEQVKYTVEYDGLDYVITGGEKCDFSKDFEASMDENNIHNHKLICECGNETAKAYSDAETFVETVAPTCTEYGYDSYKCPDCDDTWEKNIVAALEHDLTASATSNGDDTHSVKCARENCDYATDAEECSGGTATCKDKAVCDVCKTAYGELTAHTYDDTKWEYQDDATCTEDGTEKNTCTVEGCGNVATRTAEDTATGHSMIADYVYDISGWANKPEDFDKEIKAPTCSTEGLGILYCEKCDYYKTKTAKADTSAHVWATDANGEIVWEPLSGDCGTGVTLKKTCTVCGAIETKVVTGDHTWHLAYKFEPTCTQPGIIKEVCYVCKAEKVTTRLEDAALEPVEHTYGEAVEVEANCTEAAHKEQICTVCGFVNKYDFNGDIVHMFNDGVEYEATCETDGYKEYTCSECTHVEKVITQKATKHADSDGDGKCDKCYSVMYDDSDSSRGCGCICHKNNWLMRFIYKILNFFWKLFKISKSCECGFEHW